MTVLTERTLSTTGLSRMSKVNACFGSENATSGLVTRSSARGGLVVEKMAVFKAGTFKDSMGTQMTWEPEHLMQMVFNFDLLKSRGILPNVPVRDGHPSIFGGGGNVIGYIDSLEYDQNSGRLLATYEVTEPDAVGKLSRGTYRARSSEIGMYETNDEALYWPVFMGFAFVDIPAVEGLYSKTKTDGAVVLVIEEDSVATKKNAEHSGGNVAVLEDGTQVVDLTQTDPEAPAAEVTEPEAPAAEATEPEAPAAEVTDPAEPEAPAAEADEPEVNGAAFSAPAGAFTFTVGGQPTTDFAAVQRHITALEEFAKETKEENRKAFVASLASSNKITQPQVETLTALALSLDNTQYEAFRASYESAPTVPLLAAHSSGVTNPDGDSDAAAAEERSILEERVRLHRQAGMTDEQIARTPSAQRLAVINNQTKE